MKKLIPLFVLLVLLTGCVQNPNAETENNKDNTQTEEVKSDTTLVKTKYFSLEISTSWYEQTRYDFFNEDTPNYIISFSDNVSYEEFGGGHLFSVNILSLDDHYTYYPSYKVLGSIELDDGNKYNVIVTYPTDVQFSVNSAKVYNELFERVPEIVKTIKFYNCTFNEEPVEITDIGMDF